MSEQSIREELEFLIDEGIGSELVESIKNCQSFSEAGVLTNNEGIVLKREDGSEYQITIVQSKFV